MKTQLMAMSVLALVLIGCGGGKSTNKPKEAPKAKTQMKHMVAECPALNGVWELKTDEGTEMQHISFDAAKGVLVEGTGASAKNWKVDGTEGQSEIQGKKFNYFGACAKGIVKFEMFSGAELVATREFIRQDAKLTIKITKVSKSEVYKDVQDETKELTLDVSNQPTPAAGPEMTSP